MGKFGRLTLVCAFAANFGAGYAIADELSDSVRSTLAATYPIQMMQIESPVAYGTPAWDATFEKSVSGMKQILPADCTAEGFRTSLCGVRVDLSSSASMMPTIDQREFLISLPYPRAEDIRRGDVIVFSFTADQPKIRYIKRVIGLPGETIELKGGVVHINGKPVTLEATGEDISALSQDTAYKLYRETLPEGRSYQIGRNDAEDAPALAENAGPYTVPDSAIFVLGDNRHNSADSRFMEMMGGKTFVPIELVLGRTALIYISTDPARTGLLIGSN